MLRIVLVTALATGCEGGEPDVPPDLATMAPDLATMAPDLAIALDLATAPSDIASDGGAITKLNCVGFSQCMYLCISGGTDIGTCGLECSNEAKPGSGQKWITAVFCGQSYCVGDFDMMTGPCVQVAVPGMAGNNILCDPGTTYAQCTSPSYVSTTCSPCLEQARNFWYEDSSVDPQNPGPPTGMCSQPTSTYCMGAQAACMTQFDSCRNDP